MHVHGAHLNPDAYAAVEAEKTAAKKRAAGMRKKPLVDASEAEGEDWLQPIPVTDEGNEDDSPPRENQNPQASKKNNAEESDDAKNDDPKNDAGEEDESGDPLSIWG
jgi:hypothetical protein